MKRLEFYYSKVSGWLIMVSLLLFFVNIKNLAILTGV